MSHVVVVGGGIAGLACAYELTGGAAGPSGATPTVTILEPDNMGGKLQASTVADRTVDVGPDGFLARRPEATALVTELGEADSLEPVGAQGAWVYARGKLRRLPQGLALGVPTRLRDLRTRDAVGILGVRGALRAAVDLVAPRPASRSALSDRAIGPLVAHKLGQRVVDVLVDPLVGGIHAGRVRDLSAAAVFPPVLAAGQGRGSMMRALQAGAPGSAPTSQGPAFLTLRAGLGSLGGLMAASLAARGVEVRATAALAVHRGRAGEPRWIVETSDAQLAADGVVLAVPAAAAATLLAPLDIDAAALCGSIDSAGVVVTTLQFDHDAVALPDAGTGILVPMGTRFAERTFLTTAVTFLDRKWPHLAEEGSTLVRVSAGRVDDLRWRELGDDDVVAQACEELAALLGGDPAPNASLVTRWPEAFPQYRVNHLVRVEGIEKASGALGGVAVAGAAYRGVGIPACVLSGRSAARSIRAWLAAQS